VHVGINLPCILKPDTLVPGMHFTVVSCIHDHQLEYTWYLYPHGLLFDVASVTTIYMQPTVPDMQMLHTCALQWSPHHTLLPALNHGHGADAACRLAETAGTMLLPSTARLGTGFKPPRPTSSMTRLVSVHGLAGLTTCGALPTWVSLLSLFHQAAHIWTCCKQPAQDLLSGEQQLPGTPGRHQP
jgi:hypothetical protein